MITKERIAELKTEFDACAKHLATSAVPLGEFAYEEMMPLLDEIERLQKLVGEYARHTVLCSSKFSDDEGIQLYPCDCGFEEAMK